MKHFLKIVSVYVGAFFFFLAQRACVVYIWSLLFKYAFICIPNTGRHIRMLFNASSTIFSYVMARTVKLIFNEMMMKSGSALN